jgi:4-alpha-glucanotransferase
MKIHLYLRYSTRLGQSLFIKLHTEKPTELIPLDYLNTEYWHTSIEMDAKSVGNLQYSYHFKEIDGSITTEWGDDRSLDLGIAGKKNIFTFDVWNAASSIENAFLTQPFQQILLKNKASIAAKKPKTITHVFKVKAPLLDPDECLCLLGGHPSLQNWQVEPPMLMSLEGNWWTISVEMVDGKVEKMVEKGVEMVEKMVEALSQPSQHLSQPSQLSHQPSSHIVEYKYGIWNKSQGRFIQFEGGVNRKLPVTHIPSEICVVQDGFARFQEDSFKGAGTAIPIFSLRTEKSFGVGEFTDMHLLVDWAKSVGLKLIQLLPINDTSATDTWTDSYPYASISAFALNPVYLNVEQLAGKKNAAIYKPYAKTQAALNALLVVDYEKVLTTKWEIARLLFKEQQKDWSKDKEYLQYLAENKHWLLPYAAFCYLKAQNGTTDFNQWKSHKVFDVAAVYNLFSDKSVNQDDLQIHLFIQWHLHLQLKNATDYAHQHGIVVKGDIPIGIYRYSCDAWVAPDLYNMNAQAGAPPDDFAEKGQNWGFPTYNWQRMQEDGFAWWKQRFAQMSLYFDAFRIDHILGFFRIWSIPLDAVEGLFGHFVPALPVKAEELLPIGLDYDRLCRPYITDDTIFQEFGDLADTAKHFFLGRQANGRYHLKSGFETQQEVENYLKNTQDFSAEHNARLRTGLFNVISNVLLFEEIGSEGKFFHFRINIEKTSSFKALDAWKQQQLRTIYLDYFYSRQDDFWKIQAMEKLPALKRSTNMLICGEDLGMVPDCVPGVMKDLGFLTLEIQRMPKDPKTAFFHPKDAPYLSVVTPSTHDMSTIRGWWEEDKDQTKRFYNEILQRPGYPPFFCEPWINHQIIEQHFYSPAMWAIFQIQDLMGIDGQLRRENPEDERINVPANPKHYWQYRMHLTIEDLMLEEKFNGMVRAMVAGSGRG